MILLARGLARLTTFLLLVALALAGAIAGFGSIGSGNGGVSLPGFARLLHLDRLEASTGELLGALESDGPIAILSALGGLGAIALGVFLLVGLLWPRRERLVVLRRDEAGLIAARRRPLGQVAEALAEQVGDVAAHRGRVRPARRGKPGGRLRVRATARESTDATRAAVERELEPLSDDLGLRTKVTLTGAQGVD